uniref:Predicted protein n=1 Tax=Hordeum vulgare subsp. vulgare TaxID=112509 RepID=F2DZP7_HORVV|nr:predicted protein [Hordeum vulgare subsp. vulgare]
MDVRRTAQVNQVVGAVGVPPPPQIQTQDPAGVATWSDPEFMMLRTNTREKIFKYIERKTGSDDWRRRLPELARRLEEILFMKYPSKREYYCMMRAPIEPQLQYAIKTLSARNQQNQQNLASSRQIASSPGHGTMILTPGITQGASENSRMSYVTGNIGPSSSSADMVPPNTNMGTLLPGEAPDEHVNTLLSLGMNPTQHDHPRANNNNLMIDTVDIPATNRLLKSRAPVKEVRNEPKFSCPVCMNELVDPSSTICGHIFCQKCIQASIQAQSKCPTCRRTLTVNCFHRVYLPTMD